MESVPTSGEDQHATTTVSKDADDLVSEIHSQNVECFNSTTSWKFAVTEGRDSPLFWYPINARAKLISLLLLFLYLFVYSAARTLHDETPKDEAAAAVV